MAFIKYNELKIGKKVILTEEKESLSGKFTIGSEVTITDYDQMRGYSFSDDKGNRVIEAGFGGFREI